MIFARAKVGARSRGFRKTAASEHGTPPAQPWPAARGDRFGRPTPKSRHNGAKCGKTCRSPQMNEEAASAKLLVHSHSGVVGEAPVLFNANTITTPLTGSVT